MPTWKSKNSTLVKTDIVQKSVVFGATAQTETPTTTYILYPLKHFFSFALTLLPE